MTPGFVPDRKTPLTGRFAFPGGLLLAGAAAFLLGVFTTEHFPPWVSWHAEVPLFAAAAGTALAALLSRKRPLSTIGLPSLGLPFLVLLVLTWLQWATGRLTFAGDALVVSFYAAFAVACIASGFASGQGDAMARLPTAVAVTLVVAGVYSTLVALLQVFELDVAHLWVVRMSDPRRPGGNLAQPNQLATLLASGLAAVAFLAARSRLGPSGATALAAFLALGVVMTESRAGMLEVAVLLAWWHASRRKVAPDAPAGVTWAAAAAFALLVWAWPVLLAQMDLLGSSQANRLNVSGDRQAVWAQLLQASLLHPWVGWGVLELPQAHNAVAHLSEHSQPFTYAHNVGLDLVIWFGWPVALGALFAAGLWLWRRVRAQQDAADWFGLATVLVLAVHSLVEYPFAYAYLLGPCLLLAGWSEGRRGLKPVLALGRRTAAAMVAVVAGLMAWSAVEYLLIEEDFRIVRFENLRMGVTPAEHHMPDVVLLDQLGALLRGTRLDLRPGMPAEEFEMLRDLALRYPWSSMQYRYAVALALNGDPAEGVRQLKVLRVQRGERTYRNTLLQIQELAEKYPQLRVLLAP